MSPRVFAIPDDLPDCPRCGSSIRLASRVGERAHVRPCGHTIPATALRPSHDDESHPISAVADGGRDIVELVDKARHEPTVRCTVCDELIDVADCHSRSAVIERLREHRDTEHDVDVGDGIETDGGRIDPLVCPRGHYSVKVGASRFGCQTCRKNGYEPCRWDRSELVDLRDEDPPLADDERGFVTDGGRDVDEDDERVVMNPNDASEIAGHYEHDGFSVFRFGAGELVDIYISCDQCSIRWIIEDVPKDKAENPGKYVDDEGGDSA